MLNILGHIGNPDSGWDRVTATALWDVISRPTAAANMFFFDSVLKKGRLRKNLLSCVFATQKLSAHTSFGENGDCATGRGPRVLRVQVEISEPKISENVNIFYRSERSHGALSRQITSYSVIGEKGHMAPNFVKYQLFHKLSVL